MRSFGKLVIIALILVLILIAGWQLSRMFWPNSDVDHGVQLSKPDPRITYKGPFQNLHPKVKYAGDDKCRGCHDDIVHSFRRHPMGRSLRPIADAVKEDVYSQKNRNPFDAFQSMFLVEHDQNRMVHRQKRLDSAGLQIYEHTLAVVYEIGSGAHGKSYLIEREGHLFMSPVTFYSQKSIWDVSPGFPRMLVHGRNVEPGCLYCHTNRAQHVEGTLNQYDAPIFNRGHAIGCERCHGPAELHINNPGLGMKPAVDSEFTLADPNQRSKMDSTIVNPRHLPARLRDAVCEQCHLTGDSRSVRAGRELYDFRPGLPLESCWSIFVDSTRSGSEVKLVNHVEQVRQSLCWQKSGGANKLTCISCHDPHFKPSAKERVGWFRKRCTNCHGDSRKTQQHPNPGCSLPMAKRAAGNNDCIGCHMPFVPPKEIGHAAFSDHRIIRRPGHTPVNPNYPPQSQNGYPLVHFHKGAAIETDKSYFRDIGVAMALAHGASKVILTRPQLEAAHRLLAVATEQDFRDWRAWESRAKVEQWLGRYDEALATCKTVLKHAPKREEPLRLAAELCLRMGRSKDAVNFLRKLVTVNKWEPRYQLNLASVLADQNNWSEATKRCGKARSMEPENVAARQLWIRCLLKSAKRKEAEAELSIIKRMAPNRSFELELWYSGLR